MSLGAHLLASCSVCLRCAYTSNVAYTWGMHRIALLMGWGWCDRRVHDMHDEPVDISFIIV